MNAQPNTGMQPTTFANPMGVDGFEFVEFAAPDPKLLHDLFKRLGFTAVAGLALDTMGGLITRFRLAAQPPDVLVTVPTDAAGLLDFHRADELIELGRRLTTEALDAREPEPDEPAASTPEI